MSGPRSAREGLKSVRFSEKLYDADTPTPELLERLEELESVE